jgi:hypothetical protein
MSGKLFAFNVSKKVERADEKAHEQWVGDQTAWARSHAYCTGSPYGVDGCVLSPNGLYCYAYGSTGFYLCDNY